MKVDLAVIGQGAVTPAGVSVDALLHRESVPISVASLRQPDQSWPVLRVDLKDPAFARWQREPRLRRASSMTFFLVEAAQQALAEVTPADRAETGLIVAFSAGCLVYSRRFFEGIVKQGQKTASPALFPETVFNSPVSHMASVLGLNGAAYALVGDEAAWAAAIKTASIWLKRGRVKQVLVLGAEEFDPIVLDAYRSAGWLRRQNSAHGFLTSEGAAGLLVREANADDENIISIAQDGLIYRTKKEASTAAENLLAKSEIGLPCYPSAQHNWLGSLEKIITAGRSVASDDTQPYLGEAFTASAAWHTLRALACLNANTTRILQPVWGLNHQLASLQLEKKK
jgi:3-oxoacyl-(acyl-carrier-protein) synthase